MGKGSRYTSGKKICGTCGSWGGDRELDGTGTYAIMKNQWGKCLDRKGKFNLKLSDGNHCNAWSKWGPLK